MLDFGRISLETLASSTSAALDELPFGVVGVSADGLTVVYNATEAKFAGLPPDRVVGVGFFTSVAQCMNNFMVAQRFVDEPEIDATIDFILTFRMRPTRVKLRLLQSESAPLHFILIDRNS